MHRNERPFNCRCGKAYISSSGLRTHWKTTDSCSPTLDDLEKMNKTAEYLAVVEKEMQLNTNGVYDQSAKVAKRAGRRSQDGQEKILRSSDASMRLT